MACRRDGLMIFFMSPGMKTQRTLKIPKTLRNPRSQRTPKTPKTQKTAIARVAIRRMILQRM